MAYSGEERRKAGAIAEDPDDKERNCPAGNAQCPYWGIEGKQGQSIAEDKIESILRKLLDEYNTKIQTEAKI